MAATSAKPNRARRTASMNGQLESRAFREDVKLPKQGRLDEPAITIGKLARFADVSADTIRFYEDEQLLMPTRKTEAGYRLYGPDALRRLDFIKHAQHCGMTLAEIRQLLEMRADESSCCSDIRSLAIRKKLELEHKIKAMQAMSLALSKLIDICTAEDQPLDACPILAALESSTLSQTSHLTR